MARREYRHDKGLPGIPLKYIESTGEQYIDTGIPLNTQKNTITKFQILQYLHDIWGGYVYNTNQCSYYCYGCYNNQILIMWGRDADGLAQRIEIPFDTNIHTSYLLKSGIRIDNVATVSYRAIDSSYLSDKNYILFARYYRSSVENGLKSRIYDWQMLEDDEVTVYRHFIPLLLTDQSTPRIGNGDIGLYDTVEGKFYGSMTETNFLAGPPAEWDELEYIKTNGNSYIDTGIPLSNQYNTIIKFRFLAYKAVAWLGYIWGSYGGDMAYLVGMNSGSIMIIWGAYTSSFITKIPFDTNVHTAYVFKNSIGFDDNPRENKYAEIPSGLLQGRNYILGNRIQQDRIEDRYAVNNCCLYGWQALNDDNIIQADFIPCRATSSILGMNEGDVGMWDKVSATLKKSASNNQFLAGPLVISL